MKIYGCYISGGYNCYMTTEKEAQEWASTNGIEFNGYWLQGQYTELEVSASTAQALLENQPVSLGHEEALNYQ